MIQPIVEGHGEVPAVPVWVRKLAELMGIPFVPVGAPFRSNRSQLGHKDGLQRVTAEREKNQAARRFSSCSMPTMIAPKRKRPNCCNGHKKRRLHCRARWCWRTGNTSRGFWVVWRSCSERKISVQRSRMRRSRKQGETHEASWRVGLGVTFITWRRKTSLPSRHWPIGSWCMNAAGHSEKWRRKRADFLRLAG